MNSQTRAESSRSGPSISSAGRQSTPTFSPSHLSSSRNPRLINCTFLDDCAIPHPTKRVLSSFSRQDSTEFRRECIRELAAEVETAAKSLHHLGHTVPSDPLPEVQALQDAMYERKAAARVHLMTRLSNVTQTELELLDVSVGERLNRFYLQCYVGWRVRDGDIVARAMSSVGAHVQPNTPAA